ncbi:ABA4-like family protein [uncultured Aquimarina sp.]|uniref:ABA4-like family protein n=1 Tax=uncultured Aquimarina sp. TaxID=575652 RepID=UPI00261A1D2B|nr:ABA4-like family protein [uncultured Aquimarina sp.]
MTPTDVFSFANMIAMPMWILMVLLPKWKVTRFLIDFKIVPLLLSIVYAIYIFLAMQIGGGMDFGSLSSVMELFTEENAVLAGWVHYLAFDLMVGMWILDQNKKLGIHQLLIAPCLFATFMLGPIGFLLFIIIRTIKLKK